MSNASLLAQRELERLRRRVNDLLVANNLELEKRRAVERELNRKVMEYVALSDRMLDSCLAEATDGKDCWIQTYTGLQFFPLAPSLNSIVIEDIAHALSLQCRFAGHVRIHYSVAEHSVRIAKQLQHDGRNEVEVLWGLLHDASEAYLSDMTRPLKRTKQVGDGYRVVEAGVMRAVCLKFGLPLNQPECVSEADMRILITEKRDLLGPSPAVWTEEQGKFVEPYPWKIDPWTPEYAELKFLEMFHALTR